MDTSKEEDEYGQVPAKRPRREQTVTATDSLPPWDKENPEEAGLLCMSEYKDLINKNRVKLCEELEPDRIWAHLRQLHVLDKVTEERLKYNLPRPDVVPKVLEFIESGPQWHFHAFCRALALTGQSDMIPEGGLEPKIYEESATYKQLPKNLVKLIREHCKSNVQFLMKTRFFDFEGDLDDVSQCLVPDPMIKGSQQQMIAIPTNQILDQLRDKVPPRVVQMYGDPGDGKTSLMKHIAHCWSAEFLKWTDKELSSKCTRWNTIVYLSAPKIKGTVEEAIWDELGCKESGADTLMDHITSGDGTGVFIDSLDEVRDQKVIENIKRYVHQRKKKGGPTVFIAARTDLCPIDPTDIDRTITVQGFTEAQGLHYVKQYTEMCEEPEKPPLVEYVTQHKEELKSVLTNPMRLYLFSALAIRGELDLVNERVFNIPKLFGPLEKYLLRKEGSEVTDVQRRDFYRLCMYGMLTDLREFPESLLAKFNIAKAYYIFLRRSSRPGSDGAPAVYYSFGQEMLYEYFASRYIQSLTTEERKFLLVSICNNEQLRNVQYIVFQFLLQEWETQKDLIVSMIRCMLILQFTAPDNKVEGKFIDLMSLHYTVENKSSLEGLLEEKQQEVHIRNSSKIWEGVNSTFDKSADRLQESGWYGFLYANGTVNHVTRCLRACSVQQQEALYLSTISCLLPCRWMSGDGEAIHFFQVDSNSTRCGQVVVEDKSWLALYAWCPSDAYKVLMQYLRKYSGKGITKARICLNNEDALMGKAFERAWSKDEWFTLTKELTALDELSIAVYDRASLEGMLSCLADYAPQLKHSMEVNVFGGTVTLGLLMNTLPRCIQVPQLSLQLRFTPVIVPSGQDEDVLVAQRNLVCRIGRPGLPRPIINPILYQASWVTESGEKYAWSDGMC